MYKTDFRLFFQEDGDILLLDFFLVGLVVVLVEVEHHDTRQLRKLVLLQRASRVRLVVVDVRIEDLTDLRLEVEPLEGSGTSRLVSPVEDSVCRRRLPPRWVITPATASKRASTFNKQESRVTACLHQTCHPSRS